MEGVKGLRIEFQWKAFKHVLYFGGEKVSFFFLGCGNFRILMSLVADSLSQ